MQPGRRLLTAVLAAVVLAVGGLALASCGDDDETTDRHDRDDHDHGDDDHDGAEQPTVVRVVVVDGEPQGGIVRATVDEGDRVLLVVRLDVADEVHLHGYDLSRPVAAGGSARIAFRATLPGRFEVELEERGAQIAELTVRP